MADKKKGTVHREEIYNKIQQELEQSKMIKDHQMYNLKFYRAIDIILGKNCNCELSRLAGKRMLSSKVIELFTSSRSRCDCTFRNYDDRRHLSDKRKFDAENVKSNPHNRTKPYRRRVVDIHNRSRDRFTNERMGPTFTALQQAG